MNRAFIFFLILSWSQLAFGSGIEVFEKIRELPKAELHIHLGGAYPLEYLQQIATEEQFALLEVGLREVAGGMEYEKCFPVFDVVSQIVNTEERVEKGAYALCKQLEADGVTYVELRSRLKDLGKGYSGYLEAILRGIRSASENLEVHILLSVQRNSTESFAQATLDLAREYRSQGVVGIDISGDSTIGDITKIIPILQKAKEEGLFVVVHMGESPREKDQLLLLESLNPDRVGHAVHLVPEAYQWIRERKTPVEVCLTSSELSSMVEHHTLHPGIELFRENHPIAISTDDPLIFGTSLTQEFTLLFEGGILTFEEIEKLIQETFLLKLSNK